MQLRLVHQFWIFEMSMVFVWCRYMSHYSTQGSVLALVLYCVGGLCGCGFHEARIWVLPVPFNVCQLLPQIPCRRLFLIEDWTIRAGSIPSDGNEVAPGLGHGGGMNWKSDHHARWGVYFPHYFLQKVTTITWPIIHSPNTATLFYFLAESTRHRELECDHHRIQLYALYMYTYSIWYEVQVRVLE